MTTTNERLKVMVQDAVCFGVNEASKILNDVGDERPSHNELDKVNHCLWIISSAFKIMQSLESSSGAPNAATPAATATVKV